MNRPAPSAGADWRDDIFAALQGAEIRQIGYVPDAGHSRLIELCHADPAIRAVPLTSEEEGIGLAAGAWLGGQRAALLMQSSGVGNCVNLLSLAKSCRFPMTLLVTMRGEWGEFNPWQVPMGTKTQAALELMDVLVYRVERAEEAGETAAAASQVVEPSPVTSSMSPRRSSSTRIASRRSRRGSLPWMAPVISPTVWRRSGAATAIPPSPASR